jgi:hypothetical protein
MYRARGPRDAEYIDAKLEREGFKEAGRFADYSAQVRSLRLPPWAYPPCWISLDEIDALIAAGDDPHGKHIAAKLLKRMLALGISKYHPDPMAAIEAATKRDAAA